MGGGAAGTWNGTWWPLQINGAVAAVLRLELSLFLPLRGPWQCPERHVIAPPYPPVGSIITVKSWERGGQTRVGFSQSLIGSGSFLVRRPIVPQGLVFDTCLETNPHLRSAVAESLSVGAQKL
jgi:hypothetical protein